MTNARFLEFVDAGGYRDRALVAPEDWAWLQREGVAHPLFWERRRRRWHWRGMFELIAAAAVVAGLRQPRRGVGVSRAGAARGCRPKRSSSARRYGSPAGERRHPWGDAEPRRAHGVFDFSSWDPEPAGSHPRGASAWGVEDLVGNGWEWTSTPFAPFPGFRAMASYPEYSGRLLRRRALRHERRVAGDGARAAAADVPQLVPRPLSLRLRDVPLRPMIDADASGAASTRVRRATSQHYLTLHAAAAAVALLLRRARLGAVRGDLPAAVVSASRAPRRGLLAAHGRDDLRARRAARRRSSSSARAAATSWRRWSAPAGAPARGSTVHLVDVSAAALDLAEPHARRARRDVAVVDAPGDLRGGLADACARRARPGATLALFLGSNIGNFDPPGADAFLREHPRGARGRRRAAARRRSREAGARPAAGLRRSARRDRGVQPQPARAHQPRARRRLRPRRVRASRRLERADVARRDAPGRRARASGSAFPARRSTSRSRRARRSGPRARTKLPAGRCRRACSSAPGSARSSSGSTRPTASR